MTEAGSFGQQASILANSMAILGLEKSAGKGELFTRVDSVVAGVLVRSLHAEVGIESKKGRHGDSVSIVGLTGSDKDAIDEIFCVANQRAKGTWFIPEKISLKPGLGNLPWTFAAYPRYASGIVWDERATVLSASCPDSVLQWSVLQPFFEQLWAPFELRGRLSGTKSAEEQLLAWAAVDEVIAALGFELTDELAVMRYGGGWGQLRGPEQLATKQRLLAVLAEQASEQLAARFRAYKVAPLIARYYSRSKNGQALRKSVLTRPLEKVLSGYFGGDWLSFLAYLEETPHPDEQVNTAIPAADLFVGTTKTAASVAADLGLSADEVQKALSTYWETSANRPAPAVAISPVQERVAVLRTYWSQFDEIHTRQASGMPSLWGLVEEFRGGMRSDWEEADDRYSPGCYMDLLPAELQADIESLWSATMLARWPDRIVTEISPHALMAEAFGAALKFWHGAALTAWFICEGPYSRTDMAGLAAYYVDALEELNSLNCPVDPALFAQLIEGETRLGPEEPISTKKTLVEVSPGVHFEMAMNSGTRRSGFEVLRDIITRYRRAWAEQYLNSYLKARWDTELREAARHHSEAIAGTGKPPRAKQFAKYALTATNHWLGGNMSAFYAAIGEKSVIRPERICLMPADRAGFSTSVFKALGGQPFERRIFVANREEGHVQAEEQARHAQLVWLASSSLRFTQLEEALGRSPELKEFGTPAFANRSSALSADTDEAWERYVAVVETVRQQPKLAQHVESMPEHLADEQPSQHDVAAPPPVAVRAAPEQSGS